jgi:outer membrane receptor protein involved in Fe transport
MNYSYKFKNFTLNSFVNNVLNEKYYTNLILGTGNVGYVYPQAGRTIGLEIEAEF